MSKINNSNKNKKYILRKNKNQKTLLTIRI